MRATIFALVILPLVVMAAPVPKRASTIQAVFGEVTNPKTECQFDLGRDAALTVTMPAGWDPVEPSRVAYRGPLVAKTIDGDFALTVRVGYTPPDEVGLLGKNELPAVAAGLSVWASADEGFDRNGVIVAISGTYCKGMWISDFRHYEGKNALWASKAVRPDTKTDSRVYLRVTRRGEATTEEWSSDGKTWKVVGKSKLVGPVAVGPVAFQCTDKDFVVTFDEYGLNRSTQEKK